MAKLRKSQYNIEIDEESGLVLFNTWGGKLILLDENEKETWNCDPEMLDGETTEYLKTNKFLTTEDDEFSAFSKSLIPTHPPFRYYKIMTTTNCNARCWYCFEESFIKKDMSIEVANSLVNHIANHVGSYNAIKLDWFGGEPLLNHEIISYIVDAIRLKLPHTKIISGIVTNGSLFNKKIISDAVSKWNLKRVQITLDGCKKQYEMTKNYLDSSITFEKILDNIQQLCDFDIHVSIRINYNSSTYADCCNLIDLLYQRFKHKINVYASPIFNTDFNVHFDVDENSENEIFDRLLMYGYIRKKSLLHKRTVSCSLSYFEDFFVVDPFGDLYKCAESMLCGTDNRVGNVFDSNTDAEIIEKWKNHQLRDECKKCPYFPICLGGCAANQLGITNIQCFRFKKQIPKIIKLLYNEHQ